MNDKGSVVWLPSSIKDHLMTFLSKANSCMGFYPATFCCMDAGTIVSRKLYLTRLVVFPEEYNEAKEGQENQGMIIINYHGI